MNEQAQRQYIFWGIIAIIALIGIGLIAFLIGRFSMTPGTVPPTSTPVPAPTPTSTVVTIEGIKSMAELATIEYNSVAEIYSENAADGWLDELLGKKERLLMLVYGNVQAGFDLEKLEDEDLWTDGTRVRLVLPPPEILNSSIDFEQTHIVFYENNFIFDENDPNLQGEALSQAKGAIEQSALEDGILNRANEYGKLNFENFLYSLGFTDIEVVTNAQIYKE